jgi:hypothetical protein
MKEDWLSSMVELEEVIWRRERWAHTRDLDWKTTQGKTCKKKKQRKVWKEMVMFSRDCELFWWQSVITVTTYYPLRWWALREVKLPQKTDIRWETLIQKTK